MSRTAQPPAVFVAPGRSYNFAALAVQTEGSSLNAGAIAPSFESTGIDERGEPFRIVATDPRVWVARRLWLSKRVDREPIKRRNDEAQARAIGRLVAKYMPNLPYVTDELRMLPMALFEDAAPLFKQ
jgi:hypothetical protein